MCLFCDIAEHKAAAHIVDETSRTISFLDIAPSNEGHVLVIPKLQVDSITDLPDDYVLEMPLPESSLMLSRKCMGQRATALCRMAVQTASLDISICMFSQESRMTDTTGSTPKVRKKYLRQLRKR